jgi:hypothetical protein
MSGAATTGRPEAAPSANDSIAMALTALTAGLYIEQPGFYSDDWFILARFNAAVDRSILGF